LAGGILVFAAFVCVFTVCFADESQAEKPDGNSKCYVCHPDLKTEELTTSHLDMDVTCDQCHGLSTEHMHDEMLMTKPDLLFGRAEVNKMCLNPTCHKPGPERSVYGLADHDPVAVEAFFKKWRGRMRPNGRAVTHDSVCTDCHGTHNITKPINTSEDGQAAEWITAFSGRDLAGWQPLGSAFWTVERGRITARPGANGKGGVLWTKAEYEDYLLAVTFQATWPIHAGIWLRGAGAEQGPRIEIFDSKKPIAFTGSVWVQGKGLALANLRDDLVDREGWNTLSVKVEGDRIQVWLNGEEIGVVRVTGPGKGKIGLYIEGHPTSKSTKLQVREVQIQQLTKAE
ncbi:MAG: family 16 glycoside hydrolase, partial [Planctomycetota bacterium]